MRNVAPVLMPQEQQNNEEQQERQSPVRPNNIIGDYFIGVPLFHRRDFILGVCLGKGSFSKVYSIARTRRNVKIVKSNNTGEPSSSCSTSSSLNILPSLKKSNRSRKPKFALKFLRNSTLRRGENYARAAAKDIINEVQILSFFDHENIIKVHGFSHGIYRTNPGTESPTSFDQIFLIIDRLECTLKDQISDWECHFYMEQMNTLKNPLVDNQLKVKVDIALQIAKALQYIHENGYIYRDLKPQNIGLIETKKRDPKTGQIEKHMHVKIFDFGICRKLPKPAEKSEDANKTKKDCYKLSFVGSPQYMAPEVHNKEMYNPKADVYGWSLVFYAMLTLRIPYAHRNSEEQKMVFYQGGERPSFATSCTGTFEVPTQLQKTIESAWNQEVTERYTMEQTINEVRWYINHTRQH